MKKEIIVFDKVFADDGKIPVKPKPDCILGYLAD